MKVVDTLDQLVEGKAEARVFNNDREFFNSLKIGQAFGLGKPNYLYLKIASTKILYIGANANPQFVLYNIDDYSEIVLTTGWNLLPDATFVKGRAVPI